MASPTKEYQKAQLAHQEKAHNCPIVNIETGEIEQLPMFRTRHNQHLWDNPGVINNEPSQTVPGQALSIPEMMERYRNGQSIPISDMEYLDNEDPLPEVYDLTDIQEIADKIKYFEKKVEEAKKHQDAMTSGTSQTETESTKDTEKTESKQTTQKVE